MNNNDIVWKDLAFEHTPSSCYLTKKCFHFNGFFSWFCRFEISVKTDLMQIHTDMLSYVSALCIRVITKLPISNSSSCLFTILFIQSSHRLRYLCLFSTLFHSFSSRYKYLLHSAQFIFHFSIKNIFIKIFLIICLCVVVLVPFRQC